MLIIIAILLSMDAIAAGLAFGIRKIKIPARAKIIIGICTILSGFLTVTLGNVMTLFLSPFAARAAGSFIFFAMGVWYLLQMLIPDGESGEIYSHAVKSLGITVKIVKNPEAADMNKSGTIDCGEAVFTGFALAADVMAAGLGFGLAGAGALTLSLATGMFQVIFLSLGAFIGSKFRSLSGRYEKISVMLPGIIMILLGIYRMVG